MKDDIGKLNGLGKAIVAMIVIVFSLGMIGLMMWIIPSYRVWQREMVGRSELAQAEWNKQIQVREAEANLEAEKLNAEAEVARARGMAEAMEIEGGKLTELYIHYLWVRNINERDNLIYIPTEAGLPLIEARNR